MQHTSSTAGGGGGGDSSGASLVDSRDAGLAVGVAAATLSEIYHRKAAEAEELLRTAAVALSALEQDERRHRVSDPWKQDVYPAYTDSEFRQCFRMSRETFTWFCDEIFEPVGFGECFAGRHWEAISLERRVAIFFYRLATGDSEATTSECFHCDRRSVHQILMRGLEIIKDQTNSFVSWPTGDRARGICEKFEQHRDLPKVIAAVGSCHIPIQKAVRRMCLNSKGFHSVHCFLAVDMDSRLLAIDVGLFGSLDDKEVLKYSNVAQRFDDLEKSGYWLLGEPALGPPRKWLMCPYKMPASGDLTPVQRHFNEVVSSTWRVAKRAFALLKGRFWILLRRMNTDMDTTVNIAGVCCNLHNMLLHRGEGFDMRWIEDARVMLQAAVDGAGRIDRAVAEAALEDLEAAMVRDEGDSGAGRGNEQNSMFRGPVDREAEAIRNNLAVGLWELKNLF